MRCPTASPSTWVSHVSDYVFPDVVFKDSSVQPFIVVAVDDRDQASHVVVLWVGQFQLVIVVAGGIVCHQLRGTRGIF